MERETGKSQKDGVTHIVEVQEYTSYNADLIDDTSMNDSDLSDINNKEKLLSDGGYYEFSSISGKDEDRNSDEYIDRLYENVKKYNIAWDDLARELDNILIYSVLSTDMNDESWNSLFGNLQGTIPKDVNVVEYYYPLAVRKHMEECSLEHTYECDSIVCDDIRKRAGEIQREWEYLSYISCMIYDSEDSEVINSFNRLCDSTDNIEAAIGELLTLYEFAQVPRCLARWELETYFTHLQATVTEYENIFSVYHKLAIYLHIMGCEYEHYVDECEVHVCKGLEKKIG